MGALTHVVFARSMWGPGGARVHEMNREPVYNISKDTIALVAQTLSLT